MIGYTNACSGAGNVETPFVNGSGDYSAVLINDIAPNTANGEGATAIGENTTAYGDYATSEGDSVAACGYASHAEGSSSTLALERIDLDDYSDEDIYNEWIDSDPEEDKFTLSKGDGSHCEGNNGLAIGENSHCEGNGCYAEGSSGHAEGTGSKAIGDHSHAEGLETNAVGNNSHSEGVHTAAFGNGSHSEGNASNLIPDTVTTSSTNSQIKTAWGTTKFSLAKGTSSHIEGKDCLALGAQSHAEGLRTIAEDEGAHSEGIDTRATGKHAHAEGAGGVASGSNSHSEGWHGTGEDVAQGGACHVEGDSTYAYVYAQHVEGYGTHGASPESGHTGSSEDDINVGQHVAGRFNISGDGARITGCGTDDQHRANIEELDWNGNLKVKGKLYVGLGGTESEVPSKCLYLHWISTDNTDEFCFLSTSSAPVANNVNLPSDMIVLPEGNSSGGGEVVICRIYKDSYGIHAKGIALNNMTAVTLENNNWSDSVTKLI